MNYNDKWNIFYKTGKITNPKDFDNNDWILISKCQPLSEQFIKEWKDWLDWETVSSKQKLTEQFIEEMSDYIDWAAISQHQTLSEQFIKKHSNKLDWSGISATQNISEQFIRENLENISFYMLPYNENFTFTLNFLREFENYIDWNAFWIFKKVDVKILSEFKRYVNNWRKFSSIKDLNEDVMDKFRNELYWKEMCMCSKMSEQFLEDHLNYIDWDSLCYSQILKESFIERHQDKVNWKYIANFGYYKFSPNFKKLFSSKLK